MLVHLVYASRAERALAPADIDAILARSCRYNPKNGITGVLCYDGEQFLQVLEGGRDAVNRLYADILRDARHRDVLLLDYAEIAQRRFAGWAMGRVNLAKVNPSLLLKYCERPALEPQSMSGRVSIALLEELIQTASIMGRSESDA